MLAGGVSLLNSTAAGAPSTSSGTFEVSHTDAEWRQLLTPEQYSVLRTASTETPFSSPLNDEHRSGIFGCAGCARDLFSSTTKFDSGTGWPSFWKALDKRSSSGKTTAWACHSPRCSAAVAAGTSATSSTMAPTDRPALLHERGGHGIPTLLILAGIMLAELGFHAHARCACAIALAA